MNKVLELKKIEVDGFRIPFRNCYGPSDILWLNRGVSKRSQLVRGIIVATIVVVVSLVAYSAFIILLQGQIYIKFRGTPPGVVCSSLESIYTERENQFFAGLEYQYISDIRVSSLADLYKRVLRSGVLPCFC